MNPEVKQKWTAALESGEYTQGLQALNTQDGYCCLGVLCDLYIKETGLAQWVDKPSTGITRKMFESNKIHKEEHFLPEEVAQWAGLEMMQEVIGAITTPVELPKPVNTPMRPDANTLASCNDSGLTFPQIAQIIREQL